MGSCRFALPLFLASVAFSCAGPTRPELRGARQWEQSHAVADSTAEAVQSFAAGEHSKVVSARNALARLKMLTEGAQTLSDGDPVTAEDLLGAFLQFEPDNAMALFLHGVALLDLGRTQEARMQMIASTKSDPENASGFAVLARIEFELGDVDASITALRKATLCAPEEAQHWVSLGMLYSEEDRWNEAYDALLKAVECDASDVVAHRSLGRLYLSVGEFSLAERAFRTALSLDPEDVGLRVALAHILRDLGRSEEALAMYKKAAESELKNPWLHANIASTLMELRRLHAARPHFEIALSQLTENGIDSALIYLNYGSMLEGLGDLDGAVVAYESAVEAAPQMGEAHEALGVLQLNLGLSARAQEHLIAADSLGGLHPDTLLELALLLEADNDWAGALTCSRRLLESPPKNAPDDLRRARLLLRSRHPDVHNVAAAVDLLLPLVRGAYQNHPGSWELLADAFASQGAVEDAIGALDEALRSVRSGSPVRSRFERRRERLLTQLQDDP